MEDINESMKGRPTKDHLAACADVLESTAKLIRNKNFKGIIIIQDDKGIFQSILSISPTELFKYSELIIARLTKNLIGTLSDKRDYTIPHDCRICDKVKKC